MGCCHGKKDNSKATGSEANSKYKLSKNDKDDINKLDGNFHADQGKGPISNRHCTDLWMAFLFIAFLGGMGACAIFGWARGNPDNLIIGWDNDGNGCGYSAATINYPYLYWPEMPDSVIVS